VKLISFMAISTEARPRYLHSHHHVAVAQGRHAFIYDQDLVEIHRLSALIEPAFLEFLPYHWLLVSAVRLKPWRRLVLS